MGFLYRQLTAAVLGVAALGLGFCAPASAAPPSFVYLKIDGIQGGSVADRHKDEIDISSWGGGVSGNTRGRPTFHDFNFTKHTDKASPKLLESVANGKHYKNAILTVETAGDERATYLEITLEDVVISSFSTYQMGSEVPTENLSVNYAKITYVYTEQDGQGAPGSPVRTCWNVRTSRAC